MSKKAKTMLVLGMVIFISVFLLSFMPRPGDVGLMEAEKKIAVIYIEGAITSQRTADTFWTARGGSGEVIRQLHRAASDPEVAAIVLRINSPGGSSTAAEEIGEEIAKVRAEGKLVICSMGDMAASAGYWLAAGTEKIYANPSTITGSIGVYMPYSNWEDLYQKIGIRQERIKSGPYKDIMSNDRPMRPEERELLQQMVDEIYDNFVAQVAKGRKMAPEAVRQLADGRIFTGKQAKEAGLVDELGNLQDAIAGAAAQAGIEGKVQIKEIGNENPWANVFSLQNQAELLKILFFPAAPQSAPDAGIPMIVRPGRGE